MNAPSLREIPSLLKESFQEWSSDNCMRLGAALAYYSVFSIAPLLIIVIGIASLFYGDEAARGEVQKYLQSYIGTDAAKGVQEMVQGASKRSSGLWPTLIGIVTLLLGASGVFGQLKDALNTIWEVKPKKGLGIWGFIRQRLLSFSMVLVIGFLLMISLLLTTTLAALNGYMSNMLPLPGFVWGSLNFVISMAVTTALFGLIYKFLPDAEIPWRSVWTGAIVTALLFEIGKFLLSFYLGRQSTASSYGAAGSLVLLLLWVYYTSVIIFFGAEFTEVYSRRIGHAVQPKPYAESINDEDRSHQGLAPRGAEGKGASMGGVQREEPGGILRVSREKFPAEANPLMPNVAVLSVPAKESLVTLMDPALAFDEVDPAEMNAEDRRGSRLDQIIRKAHEHPFAEVGAALGVGLMIGLISRVVGQQPELTASEHFKRGTKAATIAGAAALSGVGPWVARRMKSKGVRKAKRQFDDLAHDIPKKVHSMFR